MKTFPGVKGSSAAHLRTTEPTKRLADDVDVQDFQSPVEALLQQTQAGRRRTLDPPKIALDLLISSASYHLMTRTMR
jgi:hypothetical protein